MVDLDLEDFLIEKKRRKYRVEGVMVCDMVHDLLCWILLTGAEKYV